MNRRGFLGALVGGIAAATGLRSLARMPAFAAGRHVVMLQGTVSGKTESLVARLVMDDEVDAWPISPVRLARLPRAVVSDLPRRNELAEPQSAPASLAPPAATADLPEVWPGPSCDIAATAVLSPLAQVEHLVELFGASGDAAPAFAAALIGELVLTRMRLADLRALHPPVGFPS